MRKLKIGAHLFTVIQEGNLASNDNFGKSDMVKLELFIRNDVSKSLQEETLIHEALHIIRQLNGINGDDDEKEVQALAHGLYLFLKENNLIKELL